MRRLVAIAAASIAVGCGGVGGAGDGDGDGVFFPRWTADGAVPAALITGTLVERDRCLFVRTIGSMGLVLWEDDYRYEDGALLGPTGEPIVRVGEVLHGGGGWRSGWANAEQLVGQPIPDRCRLEGQEPMVLMYDVGAGPPPPPTGD